MRSATQRNYQTVLFSSPSECFMFSFWGWGRWWKGREGERWPAGGDSCCHLGLGSTARSYRPMPSHTGCNARRRGINESIWSHKIMDTVYVPTLVSSGHSTSTSKIRRELSQSKRVSQGKMANCARSAVNLLPLMIPYRERAF